MPTGKALLDPVTILQEADIATEMKVADLGCGTLGHFALAAAHLVGEDGQVFAVDILPAALQAVESRMGLEGVENIVTVWGDIERPGGVKITDDTIDLVILCNVAETYKNNQIVIEQVRRILKSEGQVLIVDWEGEVPGLAPDSKSRMTAEEAKQSFTKFGFTVIKEFKAGPNHWGLVMKKL